MPGAPSSGGLAPSSNGPHISLCPKMTPHRGCHDFPEPLRREVHQIHIERKSSIGSFRLTGAEGLTKGLSRLAVFFAPFLLCVPQAFLKI